MRFSGWKASFAGSFLARVCVFLCLPASGKKSASRLSEFSPEKRITVTILTKTVDRFAFLAFNIFGRKGP